MQGQFESSAEPFDASTWQWGPVHENFFEVGTCPGACVSGEDGFLYMCRAGELAAFKDATWKVVASLPNEVNEITYVVTWQGKLLVIDTPRFGEPHTAYVLDTKPYTWTKMAIPKALLRALKCKFLLCIVLLNNVLLSSSLRECTVYI
ncbi:hypothetical protein L484_019441 [Morus notabilis]|uniref:F-box/kelch-repeat protein n=1 Tax=Morus notabilis TaxID=981085 RepID=W9S4W9_9ROSA|nr:hypothetical protein L484_019441 [Morus notabilis]